MPLVKLSNSTYLDFTSYGRTTATAVKSAFGLDGAEGPSNVTLNVALILPRANDPTTLLRGDWATRQMTSRMSGFAMSGSLVGNDGAVALEATAECLCLSNAAPDRLM